jgi:hypothetical protein
VVSFCCLHCWRLGERLPEILHLHFLGRNVWIGCFSAKSCRSLNTDNLADP